MELPTEFAERLESRFDGRFRIRWSEALHEWHLEQRIRRGIAEGFANVAPPTEEKRRQVADDLIRARDGYVLTMRITTGTTGSCKVCGFDFHVPVQESVSKVCEFCMLRGNREEIQVGYWPLNDALLQEIERIDPDNVKRGKDGIDRVADAARESNRRLELSKLADALRPVDAAARERFNRLVGIPQVGFAGRPYIIDRS